MLHSSQRQPVTCRPPKYCPVCCCRHVQPTVQLLLAWKQFWPAASALPSHMQQCGWRCAQPASHPSLMRHQPTWCCWLQPQQSPHYWAALLLPAPRPRLPHCGLMVHAGVSAWRWWHLLLSRHTAQGHSKAGIRTPLPSPTDPCHKAPEPQRKRRQHNSAAPRLPLLVTVCKNPHASQAGMRATPHDYMQASNNKP